MAPINQAALLESAKTPFVVRETPYTTPGPNELVVKNRSLGINPVDAYKQLLGDALLPHIKWPCILGADLAGDVVEVGSAVTRFKVGDRVMAYAVGTLPFSNLQSEGAYQHYTVVREHLTAPLPTSVTYDRACGVPLCLATASYGLFHEECLGLGLPATPAANPMDQAVVITSGASSVGSNAIQLAVAAGYEVYTTASPKNFELMKRLGASGVFDYHDENCADSIIAAVGSKKVAGALSINPGGVEICHTVLKGTSSVKFIADAGPPPQGGYPEDVKSRFIDPKDVPDTNGVIAKIFRDFVPHALVSGQLVPALEPLIVGQGLGSIQEAAGTRLQGGVSAQKIVVTL